MKHIIILLLVFCIFSCSKGTKEKQDKQLPKDPPNEEIEKIKDLVRKHNLLNAEANVIYLKRLYPESGEIDFLYGIIHFNQENYDKALEMLLSAENKGYSNLVLNLILANTYELKGDVARAKYRYKLIIKEQKEKGQDCKSIEIRVSILTNLQTIKNEEYEPIYYIRKGVRSCEKEEYKVALNEFLLGLGRFYYLQEQGKSTWAANQSELEWMRTAVDNLYQNDQIEYAKWNDFLDYCFTERFSGLFEYLEALYLLNVTL
ncbi:MAG: hypothetical protein JXA60_04455 [Candidatus Coatesbacteria bacterium]|nr:hypothetical protein [Candidatus Coatesbacteria bacterium]